MREGWRARRQTEIYFKKISKWEGEERGDMMMMLAFFALLSVGTLTIVLSKSGVSPSGGTTIRRIYAYIGAPNDRR